MRSPPLSRPPPICTTAMPIAWPSIAVTMPLSGASMSRITLASGSRCRQTALNSEGPPNSTTIRSNISAAWPLVSASRSFAAAPAGSDSTPAKTSNSAPNASVNSINRLFLGSVSASITTAISSALPAAEASGWFISVISAAVLQPAPLAVLTRDNASARASSSVSMNAPVPTFTSKISESSPAASFFDRIDAVIRSTLSTVDVTSRTA